MTKDTIKKKLNDLDTKLSKLTTTLFSYQTTLLEILIEAGITDQETFRSKLAKHKAFFKKVDDESSFIELMKWMKKKKK